MPLDTTSPDNYSAPTSDRDPYASSSSTTYASSTASPTLPSHIDLAALPHGLAVLGPLTGYTPTALARILASRYASLSETLSRPLTAKEQTALAQHTARGVAIASYGPTIGISAAAYRTYVTREEFRWPFYGKLMSEEAGTGFWDGEKMRLGGKEILAGVSRDMKVRLLHSLRGMAYMSIGMFAVPAVVSAYASTVSAVGEIRDERLRGVTRELRAATVANSKGRNETEQGTKNMGQIWRQRTEKMERGRGRGRRREEEEDEASPTSGGMMDYGGADEERGPLSGIGDMGGMLSDGEMRTQEVRQQPEAGRHSPENRAGTFQMEKVGRQPRGFGDDYDDASPTGGSGATSSGDGGGSSVWERIRQDAASGSSGGTPSSSMGRGARRGGVQQEQQEGSTTGDSFSFSSSEEERSYAKEEAQREFDESVEKERRGGNFSGGGGGWRR
ncbi:hypothetical protein MMC28_008257 [Mycoblastus sanguinarius]|nr:hypothetical protein [Mycoblastus sanguinarius]